MIEGPCDAVAGSSAPQSPGGSEVRLEIAARRSQGFVGISPSGWAAFRQARGGPAAERRAEGGAPKISRTRKASLPTALHATPGRRGVTSRLRCRAGET